MGDEPFQAVWREIFQTAIGDNLEFTDAEIYQLFLKHAPTDRITRVNQVFINFHGGDFVASPKALRKELKSVSPVKGIASEVADPMEIYLL